MAVAGARGEGDDPAAGEMLETGQANLGSGGRQGGSEDSSEASRRELGTAGGEELEEGSGETARRGGRAWERKLPGDADAAPVA